mmetsp:Transcript_38727/g.72662  ORF Transcript_38727/g.72662 Transcript_38727/m.72662 type:complete len:218 (-) Transcript_38727:273-926(-)
MRMVQHSQEFRLELEVVGITAELGDLHHKGAVGASVHGAVAQGEGSAAHHLVHAVLIRPAVNHQVLNVHHAHDGQGKLRWVRSRGDRGRAVGVVPELLHSRLVRVREGVRGGALPVRRAFLHAGNGARQPTQRRCVAAIAGGGSVHGGGAIRSAVRFAVDRRAEARAGRGGGVSGFLCQTKLVFLTNTILAAVQALIQHGPLQLQVVLVGLRRLHTC